MRSDIEQLLNALRFAEQADRMIAALTADLQVALESASEEDRVEFAHFLAAVTSKFHERMPQALGEFYAKEFTEGEIHELTAFFLSPLGKRYVATTEGARVIGRRIGKEVSEEFQRGQAGS